MIYRLEIENFRSIRDRQVLDLTIPPNVPDPDNRFAPLSKGSKLRAPKAVAIFGANASGKTTILTALGFLFAFIGQGDTSATPEQMGLGPFADANMLARPISFAIEVTNLASLAADGVGDLHVAPTRGVFRYEVKFAWVGDQTNGQYAVSFEALRFKPTEAGRWHRMFERDADGSVKGASGSLAPFPVVGFSHIVKTLPSNASLIPIFARFQHEEAQKVQLWANASSLNLGHRNARQRDDAVVKFLAQHPETISALNRELRRIDLGIDEMGIWTVPAGIAAWFQHDGLEHKMGWEHESQGTKSFISLFPILEISLQSGSVAVIDELDDQIHPMILPEIVGWFYDRQERNTHNAQLWFSCHAASLLDDLVKEQVVLCEKRRDGATEFYSLMDVEKVRRSDNLYKKYLGGIYGGVPQIG